MTHLRKKGFCCVTDFKGEGTGHYSDARKELPTLDHPFLHSKVAKIEILVSSNHVNEVIQIFHEQGKTGLRGDGLIYITDVTKAVRVKDLSVDSLEKMQN